MQIASCKGFILNLFMTCVVMIMVGCHSVPQYSVSPQNVANIREARNNISLGEFSGGSSSVICRSQPILANGQDTESKNGFATYIRKAFEAELASAGAKPSLPTSKLSLNLLNVDVSCKFLQRPFWTIDAEVTIEGLEPFTVKTQRDFDFVSDGDGIYNDVANAFPSAVQSLIAGVIAHPTFRSAIYKGQHVINSHN